MRFATIRMLDGDSAKYVDDAGAAVDVPFNIPARTASVLYGKRTGTLFEQAKAYLVMLTKEQAQDDKAIQALSRMWITGEVPEGMSSEFLEHAIELLPKSNTFEDFAQGMKSFTESKLARGTKTGAAEISMNSSRTYGFAAQAIMQAAVTNRMVKNLIAEQVGFTPEAMKALEELTVSESALTANEIAKHVDEAFALLNRLGIPPRTRTLMRETSEDIRAGFMMLQKSETTEAVLIPRQMIKAIDDNMGNIIKSLDEYTRFSEDAVGQGLLNYGKSFMRLLRTSITTGLFFHSPRYLIAMMAGNFSQVLTDPLGSVAQVGITTAQLGTYAAVHGVIDPIRGIFPKNTPVLGKVLDDVYDSMVAKFGADKTLPTIIGSLWNRHVANFFDAARCGDDVVITLRDGRKMTMGMLREEALREGVLTTYASTELIDMLSRASIRSFDQDIYEPLGLLKAPIRGYREAGLVGAVGKPAAIVTEAVTHPMRYLTKRGQIIADFADSLEQRQRAALFIDMVVNRGKTTQEAGQLVREALYDWGHAITKTEADILNNWVLFWRFWRLSLRQGARTMLEGLTRGYSGASMPITTGMSRLRSVSAGMTGTADVMAPDAEELYYENEQAWLMSQLYPEWTAGRGTPFLGNMPATEAEVLAYQNLTGRKISHLAYSMPNLTPFDSTGMLIGAMSGLGRVAMGTAQGQSTGQLVWNEADKATSALVQMSGPVTNPLMQGFYDSLFRSGETRIGSLPPTIRPSEAALLRAVSSARRGVGLEPFFSPFYLEGSAAMDDDPETRARVDNLTLNIIRMLPVLGTEMPYWIDPMLQAGELARARTGEGAGVGEMLGLEFSYLLRQYSGIMKEYAHDPQMSQEWQQRMLQRSMSDRIRRLERRRYRQDNPDNE